jgi:Holliday junction resolvasome RuvABC endonuclease subunit
MASRSLLPSDTPACDVAAVRGALLVACADAGFACVEYPPAQVKQAVCGHGRADKQQVQRMAKTLLGLASTRRPPTRLMRSRSRSATHSHHRSAASPASSTPRFAPIDASEKAN